MRAATQMIWNFSWFCHQNSWTFVIGFGIINASTTIIATLLIHSLVNLSAIKFSLRHYRRHHPLHLNFVLLVILKQGNVFWQRSFFYQMSLNLLSKFVLVILRLLLLHRFARCLLHSFEHLYFFSFKYFSFSYRSNERPLFHQFLNPINPS